MTHTIKNILREGEEEYKTMMADVFKGRLSAVYADNWLKAHDQKLLQGVVAEIERKFGKRGTQSGSFGFQGIKMGIKSYQTEADQKRDDLIASITPTE